MLQHPRLQVFQNKVVGEAAETTDLPGNAHTGKDTAQ